MGLKAARNLLVVGRLQDVTNNRNNIANVAGARMVVKFSYTASEANINPAPPNCNVVLARFEKERPSSADTALLHRTDGTACFQSKSRAHGPMPSRDAISPLAALH